MDQNTFGILGGDKRQVALAESIAADGYTVYALGFDRTAFSNGVRKTEDLDEVVQHCENIIFPLPVTVDGGTLNMPYSEQKIPLDDQFAEKMRHKQVFGGMMGKLYRTSEIWDEIDTYDYFTREELAVKNAILTAEGAVEIAMREYPGTLNGAKCLIAGFGRIGKSLCLALRGLHAEVTASARNRADLAWIEVFGCHAIHTDEIFEHGQYDIVFNTIPAPVFSRKMLAKAHHGTILIDLASAPGGIDFEAAAKLPIHAVQALSLPGRVAPKAAAEIIKNTIYNIMEE